MTKISSYNNATSPTLTDKLIGTEVDASNATKNFTIQQLLTLLEDSAWSGVPAYNDNAAAVAGGLATGKFFVTTGGGALAQGIICRVY